MDVITTALTAAIAEGGTGAAYQMLRSRLSGKAPRVDETIADLEEDPGSLSRQFAVSDALAAAGLAGDRYLRAAARNIVEELERRRSPLSPHGEEPNHAVLQVFFATDRQHTGDRHPARQFGAARGPLSYGSCEVSVPRDGRPEELPAPTLLRLQFRPDRAGHVALLRSELASREQFFPALAERIGKSPAPSALLFVHGYRVSFEDAARRTAQIAYDLRFQGIPVFYSWPSQARLSGYVVDEANIEWTREALTAFLVDFLEQSQTEHVYLLGHGLGARALTRAAAALAASRPELARRLREIILAAPDIEADSFRREIVPALSAAGTPVTLYASSADNALVLSQRVQGYPRAGDSGEGLLVVPGVETIDATGADTSFIDHGNGAAGRSALADMQHLIGHHLRAPQRSALRAVDGPAGRYWTFND